MKKDICKFQTRLIGIIGVVLFIGMGFNANAQTDQTENSPIVMTEDMSLQAIQNMPSPLLKQLLQAMPSAQKNN